MIQVKGAAMTGGGGGNFTIRFYPITESGTFTVPENCYKISVGLVGGGGWRILFYWR